jgi:hypothetical protein
MTTFANLLFGNDEAARADLETALREKMTHPALGLPGVPAQIADGIVTFLTMPLGNLAVAAYDHHQRIEEARRNSAKSPGVPEVVKLAEHKIKSKLESTVDLEIYGVSQTVLRFELASEITVESLTAVVESGRVTDLTPGAATGQVTLSTAGIELARAHTQPVELAVPKETRIVVDLTALGEPVGTVKATARRQ